MSNTLQDLMEANTGVYLSGAVSGSTWANNLSGGFGTFALTDVTSIDGVDGITGGNGLSFSGSTTTIATSTRNIATTDTFTMAFWLKVDSLSSNAYIAAAPNAGTDWNIFVTTAGDLRVRDSATILVNSGSGKITAGTWHQVFITQNGASDHVLILDGTRYTGSTTAAYGTGPLSLGAFDGLTSLRLGGDIAFFTMADEVMTLDDSQAIHERALWQTTDVYIAWGQSNMEGVDIGSGPATDADVVQYDQDGFVILCDEPADHQSPTAGAVGPTTSFGLAAHAATGTRTMIVPVAKGSTKIATGGEWASGGASRTLMYAQGDAALALSPDTHTLKGIVGVQGESDTTLTADANAYEANIDAFIADARSHFGLPNLPWVQGQLGTFYKPADADADTVKAAIEGLTDRNDYAAYANSDSLTDLGDSVHYDVASAKTMGDRLWDAMASVDANYYTLKGGHFSGIIGRPLRGRM